MKNLTLGRYVPYNSFIHRLDPRNKIFCLIALMVAIFFPYSIGGNSYALESFYIGFIMSGVIALFIIILMFISHISFKQLFGSLKTMWFIIIFLMLINVLLPNGKAVTVAFNIGTFPIYLESIFQSLKIIIRLVLLISLTMILTATTKPMDLTYALEWYMTPLKIIKFPAHEIAMTISIALRFIPTLLDETYRIMKAQESRGVDFKRGKLSKKFKAIISLIIPLFISAFQRSEELADAMEARGYNPRAKRTRYRKLRFTFNDLITFLLIGGIMSGVIIVSHYQFELMTPHFLPLLIVISIGVITLMLFTGIINSMIRREA